VRDLFTGSQKWRIVLGIELFILLLVIGSLFVPNRVITPNEGYEPSGNFVLEEYYSLKPGTYDVTIHYQATEDGSLLELFEDVQEQNTLLFGAVNLYSGDNTEKCELWVKRKTDTAKVQITYGGAGYLDIYDLEIKENHADSRMLLFILLLLFAGVDGLGFLWEKRERIFGKSAVIWAVLLAGWVVASIPGMVDYNLWGDDWGFHLLRVEGLISGLRDGQFPVRIQGNWLHGYGYAVSVFYSDLFMLIPAFFRLIGFTVSTANRMFYMCITLATLLIAYYSFQKIFQRKEISCVGAVLYVLASYRMHNLYMRSAVGEAVAMTFLPLIVYGFYRILVKEVPENREDYLRSWIPLTFGLTGVIQSHVITCEMLAFCILVLCLVRIKRVFRRETFGLLVKTVVVTVLVNFWYLVPFLDYMLTGDFNISRSEGMMIKSAGDYSVYLSHLLFLFYGQGTQGKVTDIGMGNTGAFSVGAALLLAVFTWAYLSFTGKFSVRSCRTWQEKKKCYAIQWKGLQFKKPQKDLWLEERQEEYRLAQKAGKVGNIETKNLQNYHELGCMSFWYTVVLMLLATRYIPWDTLQNSNPILEKLIMSMQFPYRFLSLACVSASVLVCALLSWFKEKKSRVIYYSWLGLLTGLALFFGLYQTNMQLVTRGFARVYNKQSMGTIYVSNGEYLPFGTDIEGLKCDKLESSEDVVITAYEKGQDTLQTTITVVNTGADGYAEIPVLYYKGYQAKDEATGELLPVVGGDNNVVRIEIPAGYNGTLYITFHSPWYWRAAEAISAATILFVLYSIVKCRASRKKQENNKGKDSTQPGAAQQNSVPQKNRQQMKQQEKESSKGQKKKEQTKESNKQSGKEAEGR